MSRNIITISESGVVTIPNEIRISISEIADLFGVYYKTAKSCIRSIEKSGIANGDSTMDCEVEGLNIYPCYYGLEMIIAVAFRVQSERANIFRNWLLRKVTASQIVVQIPHSVYSIDKYNLN